MHTDEGGNTVDPDDPGGRYRGPYTPPPPEPVYTGQQRLRVEPHSIPAALKAFNTALEAVNQKVKDLTNLPIQAWGPDPVSQGAQEKFDARSKTGGDAALEVLTKYRDQLKRTVEALEQSKKTYEKVEGANTAKWRPGRLG